MKKKITKLFIAALTITLAASPVFVSPISADDGQDGDMYNILEDYNAQMGSSMKEQESIPVDPGDQDIDQGSVNMPSTAENAVIDSEGPAPNRYWTWSNGEIYKGPGYMKGIDVSQWDREIDWAKVKAAGIDFAILRCGYGENKPENDDTAFARNVAECKKYGITYGVYFVSYATNLREVKSEVDHVLRVLKANGCKPKIPVYYNLEDGNITVASSATLADIAKTFCERLKAAGYPPGIYAGLSKWNMQLTDPSLNKYDRWVAQWIGTSGTCSYQGEYRIWQCASDAAVDGITGNVDANLLMVPEENMTSYCQNIISPKYRFITKDDGIYLENDLGEYVKNTFYKFNGYIYAFNAAGIRQESKTFWIGYQGYILDSNGRAYINKSKTKKKAAYYASPGKNKKGTLKKNSRFYVLRTSGKWSQMANGCWIKTSLTKKTALYPIMKPSVNKKYKAKLKKKTASRSGPGKEYVKKKIFKKNKKVTVIGTYGSWAKISTGQWLPTKRLKK